MLLAAGVFTAGAVLAGPLKATATGAGETGHGTESWVDPAMPEVTHRMVTTNGIRLHIAEQGQGPLVILCHGFPECWYSWRHQLGALAKSGFRAVAPDLRGYGRSDRPQQVEKYTIIDNVADLVGLVEALGADQAVIAGHDAGATIAWQAALLRPDRFRAVIALSVPFRSRGFGTSVPPTTLMPQTKDAIFYQLYFQTPEAEASLMRDVRQTFRTQFYTLSGDSPPPAAKGGFAAGMIPRRGGFFVTPSTLPPWVTESDIDVYAKEFMRTGFDAGINFYRNVDRSWELLAPFADMRVAVPAIYIAGTRDVILAINSRFIAKQSEMVPKIRPSVMLEGCGHWTQQERAPQVSAAMIDFLRSL
jgi:pimeloyl-ACP methyl ester carboxylesterase